MHRFPIASSASLLNILFPSRSNFSSMYSMMWPTQQERSHSAVHSAKLNRGTQARPPRFEAMSCNRSTRWINSCCLPAVTVIIFAHKWVLLFVASRVQPPSIQRPSNSSWLLKAAGWQNTLSWQCIEHYWTYHQRGNFGIFSLISYFILVSTLKHTKLYCETIIFLFVCEKQKSRLTGRTCCNVSASPGPSKLLREHQPTSEAKGQWPQWMVVYWDSGMWLLRSTCSDIWVSFETVIISTLAMCDLILSVPSSEYNAT